MDELELGWRTALLLVIVVQLIVVALLLIGRKYERSANRLLAALLVIMAGILTPQLIGFAGFYDAFPWLSFAPFNNDLAIGPLIWCYAWALTRGRLPDWTALLFVPALADFVYHSYWVLQPIDARWSRIGAFHSTFYAPMRTALAITIMSGGLAGAAMLYRKHHAWIRNHSSAAQDFDPLWLPLFLIAFGFLLMVWLAFEIMDMLIGPISYVREYPFYVLVALVIWAMAQTAMVRQRETYPKIMSTTSPEPEPPQRNWEFEASRLRAQIVSESWHLEPRLTAPELARRIATNETYLSRTINRGAGANFNRFINEIRVEAVKSGLVSTSRDVLTLALENGFNSKATFNRVFRDIAGQTPAQYRATMTNR